VEKYSIQHGEVKRLFEEKPCFDLPKDEVLKCITDRLSSLGYMVLETSLWTLFAEPTEDLDEAKFARVEARYPNDEVKHIFTFALLKARGRFRVLFAQSAVVV